MPLPAALLAKLAKRGICKTPQKKPQEDEEEVFAEDYDESGSSSDSSDDNEDSHGSDRSGSDDSESELPRIKETTRSSESRDTSKKASDCPNAKNPYHECTSYCRRKYGEKKFEPHPVMEKRRVRMLKIYPLLPNWREVPDLNTNRYYYWNTETDLVCWLSPSHPKAKYESKSASIPELPPPRRVVAEEYSEEPEDTTLHASLSTGQSSRPMHHQKQHYQPKRNKQPKESALDPMDPASYSEIKRGKWSAGMDSVPSVKIGSSVDED